MCRENLTFCCCALLLIVVSLVSQSCSTSDNKKDQNSIVQCEIDKNAKRNCNKKEELAQNNLHKNATKHNNDMQYEFRMKSKRNDRDDDDSMQYEFSSHLVNYPEKNNQMDFRANFTKADSKNNSNNGNDSTNYIVPYEMCDNITCIQLCCPLGNRLVDEDCIAGENKYVFPNVYGFSNDSLQSENRTVDELFQLIVQSPCQKTKHFLLNPNDSRKYDKYIIFTNGSLYLPHSDLFVESTCYCLAVVDHNQFDAIVCSETVNKIIDEVIDNIINDLVMEILSNFIIIFLSCHIVSMLCLLIVFLVYILPELRNTHSFMLRRYSSLSFIACMIDIMSYIIDASQIYFICLISALISYFFFLASFFWLSVMSFDMWWTFRKFRLRRNAKQQERKKLIYSIFAWGGPFILAIICAFMEFVPNVSKNFRPGFGINNNCWFHEPTAQLLYFYGPKSICIISSICLTIYTILKITRYEKDTTRHLRDSESRCYNDNKQWFTLYMKLYIILFIIIAINWIISTAWEFWSFNYITLYIWYILFFMEAMQNISILIIFVCKKTIIRLLLKRFCQKRKSVPKTSTRSSCYSLE